MPKRISILGSTGSIGVNSLKVISHLKIDVPTYRYNQLPKYLKSIPITKPGSRFLK